ncbi:MAG: MarR family transcriptional regulator [Novosphingobium sp.]
MAQAPFLVAPLDQAIAANDAGLALSLAVFADRPHVLAQLREDAVNAGYQVTSSQGLAALLDGDAHPLAEVVLFDCPVPDGSALAALARLDMRVRQSGAHLIVSTTMDALDAVFGCIDQSGAQLLVDPGRADFVMALGRVRALAPGHALRELAEADRMALLRLSEQVEAIAARLGGLDRDADFDGDRVRAPALSFTAASDSEQGLLRKPKPALPHPRLVRSMIRQRQQRARFFRADLFSDPAWDMLLDLTAAHAEMKQVSVTSLCIASCVPPSTAMRWIAQMIDSGLFCRVEDKTDRRRAFIELTAKASDAMAGYFALIEETSVRPN